MPKERLEDPNWNKKKFIAKTIALGLMRGFILHLGQYGALKIDKLVDGQIDNAEAIVGTWLIFTLLNAGYTLGRSFMIYHRDFNRNQEK